MSGATAPRLSTLVFLLCKAGTLHAATPALPAGTLPVAATHWLGSGQATQARSGNVLTVQQGSQQAILNWQSFNIAAGSTVRFNQPSSTAQVLNRIGDVNPSVIQGALQANGRVWLVNPNGIVFGQGAQVDVAGLVASSLNVLDDDFLSGILSASARGAAAFTGDATGFVRIDAGARIRTPTGGQVLIFAPSITHEGVIDTPDGQTLLAAGQKVYLGASDDAAMRGLTVEVSSGGSVLNLGDIVAERGNITLAGLAVNQSGRLQATTTVSRNGSIWLQAVERDEGNGRAPGTLTLGTGSRTEVAVETDSTETSTDAQTFLRSQVALSGHTITLQPGANVVAHSGTVRADATGATTAPDGTARVFIDDGAAMDVSGVDATLPMSRNFLQVALTSNELADAPLQRSGPLLGQTVTVDLRQGTTFADISAAIAQVARRVDERSVSGGSIALSADGDVVLKPGASLNVSAGSLHYQAGWGAASQLRLASGKLVDIGVADPTQVYLGLADTVQVSHDKWGVSDSYALSLAHRYNPAFDQGGDAGSVTVTAAHAVLEGHLAGQAVAGAHQRTLSQLPQAGLLSLVQVGDATDSAPGLDIVARTADTSAGMASDDALTPAQLSGWVLGADLLSHGGFGHLSITAAGNVYMASDVRLDLGAGGSLSIKQGRSNTDAQYVGDIWLGGQVHAAGGSISVTSSGSATTGQITLAQGAVLDVAGLWVNDVLDGATGAAVVKGGSVSLQAAAGLSLERGSLVDVSAGAWLTRSGKTATGTAGSISLTASRGKLGGDQNNTAGADGPMTMAGSLRAWGLAGQGGTLALRADGFALDGANAASTDTAVDLPSLAQMGFATLDISAWDRWSVLQDAITPQVRSYVLPTQASRVAGGRSLAGLASVQTLDETQRAAMAIALPLSAIGAGAGITLDPGSTLTIDGSARLSVDGSIRIAGGTVALHSDAVWSAWPDDVWSAPGIWIGDEARIDVSGAALTTISERGRVTGKVLAGGDITLDANNGLVYVASGAVVSIAGAQAMLDLGTVSAATAASPSPQRVSSQAGELDIRTNMGVSWRGSLIAHAGGHGAQGGQLSIALTAPDAANLSPQRLSLTLQASPTGMGADADLAAIEHGHTLLDPATWHTSGLDVVTLSSQDEMRWIGDVRLQAGRSVTLDAPDYAADSGGTLMIQAPDVALGHTDALRQSAASAATPGQGSLAVEAQDIDLRGWWSTQGVGRISLNASQDIRLQGELSGNTQNAANTTVGSALTGGLRTQADVMLAAQQVYPTSLSQYTLDLQASGSTLRTLAVGGDAATPWSALGSLTVHADHIDVAGVLCAPLGQLTLNANSDLTIDAGARVSTSGQGLLTLMGYTEAESAWYYALDAVIGDSTRLSLTDLVPGKSITLQAPNVQVGSGATVDVSGGGELLAWEWQKGPGGSKDILAAPGTWAIVPSLGSRTAPLDWQNDQGSTLHVGDAVYLSGIAGLADGVYTLLPAHDALLPGAYAIRVASADSDMQAAQNVVRADGSYLVAGRQVALGTTFADSRSSSFVVTPGAVVRQYSQYVETLQGSAGQATSLVQDAGRVSVVAGQALSWQGTMKLDAQAGQHGDVDVSVPGIEVTNLGHGEMLDGVWQVSAGTLSGWGARSLLLGGTRATANTQGLVTLAIGAQQVAVANDAAHPLVADDVILAATDEVSLASGAWVTARASGGSVATKAPMMLSTLNDGAVLRASATSASDGSATVVSSAAMGGHIRLAAGAVVSAAGAAVMSAGDMAVAESAQVLAPTLTISSDRINLGAGADVSSGLTLDASSWPWRQGGLTSLTLQAAQGIHLYGTLSLSALNNGDVLQTLVLDTPLVASDGVQAQLHAQALTLQNTTGASATAGAGDGAPLLLQADAALTIGAGQTLVQASDTALLAGGDLRFTGSGQVTITGNATIQAGRVTASSGAHQAMVVGGLGQWLASPTVATSTTDTDSADALGARVTLSAQRMEVASRFALASGNLTLQATDDLHLATGATLSVQGVDTRFFDVTWGSDAGAISLVSLAGDVRIDSGVSLNVAGAASGGRNGQLSVQAAQGHIAIDPGAQLVRRGDDARAGPDVQLDAAVLDDLSAWHAVLNTSGPLGQLSLRTRTGDLSVASGQVWQADAMSLVADQGAIHVDGSLTAAPTDAAGQLSLWAESGLTLGGTAFLQAQGRGDQGGQVTLAQADSDSPMRLSTGARIDLGSGDAGGMAGTLTLRVPRTATGAGGADDAVALQSVGATLSGVDHVDIEAVRVYSGIRQIGTASGQSLLNVNTVASDTAAFMAHAPDVVLRAGLDPSLAVHVRPGVEVRSAGDLTLASDWNLYGATRPGGQAGILTLRAAGNLILQGSLSDGFTSTATTAAVQSGSSWSYRLTAGADLTSSSVTTTNGQLTGDVRLAAGKLVRTGTGDIDVHAGGDVVLQGSTSTIYTAGQLASGLSGFNVPARYGAAYTHGGGNVTIDAGGDVFSLVAPTQDTTAWLYRSGTGAGTSTWWVSFKDFAQGIAALGGGDVSIRAGGNVQDISAGTATNGRLASGSDTPVVLGGGDLSVQAGGDILGGVFTVLSGQGALRSSGQITSGSLGLAPMLAMGDSSFTVQALGDVAINAAYDPTLLAPGNKASLGVNTTYDTLYGTDSSLHVASLTGDVRWVSDTESARLQFKHGSTWDASMAQAYLDAPGTVALVAATGNVAMAGDLTLMPSATGGLTVMARQNVSVSGSVTESALAPDTELATPAHPSHSGTVADLVTPSASSLLHQGDTEAVRVYAVGGNVTGPNDGQMLDMAEPVSIRAGGDIVSAGFDSQHFSVSDMSLMAAGGSIVFKTPLNASGGLTTNNQSVTVGGPGVVSLLAGHDIDLGSSLGVSTLGNLKNPALPGQGAEVLVLAGLGQDTASQLRLPDSVGLLDHLLASSAWHDRVLTALNSWLDAQGLPDSDMLTEASARQAFARLAPQRQLVLAGHLLADALTWSGQAHAVDASVGYVSGDAALHALFPLTGYAGNLSLYYSQIRTQKGGDITVLAPGGLVNAGLANPTASFAKSSSQLGIVTVKGGRVAVYASADIRVNQSRVFTLDGGDIVMWSALGSIDAGRGAKTAAYAPAPTLVIHDDGTIEYDSSAAASGSGIGVLITDPSVPAGSVVLIAPQGRVDAGEAGVRARGNVYIGALRVDHVANIESGGQRFGVPVLASPAAGLTSLNATTEATQAVNQALDQLQTAAGQRAPVASRFTVEVLDGP